MIHRGPKRKLRVGASFRLVLHAQHIFATLQFYLLFAGVWRPLASVITTLLCCKDYFSSSTVVSRAFSAICVYSKFGHHPHPVGYLCAKFRFFCGLHCWASPWRIIAYSINHSLSHSPSLFDAPGTEACTSEQRIKCTKRSISTKKSTFSGDSATAPLIHPFPRRLRRFSSEMK